MGRLEAMSLIVAVAVAVAEEGTIAAASQCLGIPLSTVYRNVREFEEHLGSRLFHRAARRTELI